MEPLRRPICHRSGTDAVELELCRRIDGAGQSGPEAAVNTAELALAGGDLEGAVAALDKLTGAPAQAAQPWLRTARQRLAAETALRRIQALLATRLGNPAIAPSPVGNAR